MRVIKDKTKMETDMPSKRRLSSRGGWAEVVLATFFNFFWVEDFWGEVLLLVVGVMVGVEMASSGAVSGGGVSGADSPSPWK